MSDSSRILSEASGPLDAQFMFIGEAPGRLGADQTAIPFHGDTTGNNFERLLSCAGIDRNRVYVTNAVLCNPRDAKGNNATPTDSEMLNCSTFLRRQIELVEPKVVATLGVRALLALSLLERHDLTLARHVGVAKKWFGRSLVPLYHPGARAMIHRAFNKQREDYSALASVVTSSDSSAFSAIEVAVQIMEVAPRPISYFALHKLFYLLEYYAYREMGRRLTDAYIVRQQNGPYVTNLFFKKILKAAPRVKPLYRGSDLYLALCDQDHNMLLNASVESRRTEALRGLVSTLIATYVTKCDAELKTASYFTTPMRKILREEKSLGRILNRPISF